ncbi:MAG: endonuclease/exonuclease/phosphatase family protein, partial [Clostridia bacterium]|nr:endonuclease/exonuclease/phosphatase family protein [Clostridia bacterium]
DPETGITHRANFPRIMTYALLERKTDGVRFLYVNTHLDHNGNNSQEVAEKVRQGQIEVLIAEIQKLCQAYGDLPTIVTGDFNVTPVASAYTTMIANGFLDSSKVAEQGEIKPTYNDRNDDYPGAIIDYIFVSPNLAEAVETYTVCPAKRDGQWISDHNAIIATITLPVPEVQE